MDGEGNDRRGRGRIDGTHGRRIMEEESGAAGAQAKSQATDTAHHTPVSQHAVTRYSMLRPPTDLCFRVLLVAGFSRLAATTGVAVHDKAANCDLIVTSDGLKNGTVQSPGYPGPYPPRTTCRYDFQGRGKERVQLLFTDFALYHPSDDSKECESIDSLMAYVRTDGRLEKIDNFCGSSTPRPLMSNGPRLMLEFRGIYSSRYARGFKAVYSFTENFGIQSGKQVPDLPCAFWFNSSDASEGIFHSPNYPGFYPRDTECHYFFNGLSGQRVRLQFAYFDVEGVSPCEANSASDYVEFSNFMARDRKYSRHCGQLQPFMVESDRKFFRVTFKSNDRLDGTGFNATFQFFEPEEASTTIRPTEKIVTSNSNYRCISVPQLILFFFITQIIIC